MANYNNGHLIDAALDSVMRQTFDSWELLIIDDCSTDGGVNRLKSVAASEHRVSLLENKRNRGVGYSKRRAVEHARGQLVAILDPDDALVEEALAVMWQAHLDTPEAALYWSEHWLCDENLKPAHASQCDFRGDWAMGYLLARPGDIHHFWMFSRDAYSRTDGFDKSLRLAEDQDLFYKLEEVGPTQYISRPLYYYRDHAGAISRNRHTATAYAFHLVTMCSALRRRKKLLGAANWNRQRDAVDSRYRDFLAWGSAQLDLKFALWLDISMRRFVGSTGTNSATLRSLRFRFGRTMERYRNS